MRCAHASSKQVGIGGLASRGMLIMAGTADRLVNPAAQCTLSGDIIFRSEKTTSHVPRLLFSTRNFWPKYTWRNGRHQEYSRGLSSDSHLWESSSKPRQSDDAWKPSDGTSEGQSTGGSPNPARAALSWWWRIITCCFRCSVPAALEASSAALSTSVTRMRC